MAKKLPQSVVLQVVYENETVTKSYGIEHATILLGMRKNGGWELPKNSKLEFSKEDGFNYRSNTGKA